MQICCIEVAVVPSKNSFALYLPKGLFITVLKEEIHLKVSKLVQ